MNRKSTDPLPLDHPAWRLLYKHWADAIPQRKDPRDRATLREVASTFNEFIAAFKCGELRAAPFILTDGLYMDVQIRTADGWVSVTRTHHTHLGLDVDELAADAWLADQLGRVEIDVPDVPPAA